MIDSLLTELATTGWQISWFCQYSPTDWRCVIIREAEEFNELGVPIGYHSKVCLSAPSLAEALEDCMAQAAEWHEVEAPTCSLEPTKPRGSLRDLLNLRQEEPIRRRV